MKRPKPIKALACLSILPCLWLPASNCRFKSGHSYTEWFLDKAKRFPETAAHCSFQERFLKREETVQLLGTIFRCRCVSISRGRQQKHFVKGAEWKNWHLSKVAPIKSGAVYQQSTCWLLLTVLFAVAVFVCSNYRFLYCQTLTSWGITRQDRLQLAG